MLPDGIPTVRVTGRYLSLDDAGKPLAGQVVFRAPSLITFANYDVILGGPVYAQLDATGAFAIDLPATDAPGMNPSDWSYSVAEQLVGVGINRPPFQVLLPAATPAVDIADIAPTDPTTPNYVAVKGDPGEPGTPGSQVYTGSTPPAASLGQDGDVYTQYTTATYYGITSTTVTLWARTGGTWAKVGGNIRGSAIIVNTTGTDSAPVADGDVLIRADTGDIYQKTAAGWGSPKGNLRGPAGAAGVVQSVNGKSAAAVVIKAADVGIYVQQTAPAAPAVGDVWLW
ncbi:hypothetical protein [Streptomyces sp. SID5910]|uniref:hypothetical protein n=1 Tax=Streptomyces sp. SID5910 TaxID=2690312 RepID=UPI00136C9626|nr:hypothetical protein [Streptomyces sp. SID5910]MYR46587.1 hypothetical protein [Streptomyces sp. SID5910]